MEIMSKSDAWTPISQNGQIFKLLNIVNFGMVKMKMISLFYLNLNPLINFNIKDKGLVTP